MAEAKAPVKTSRGRAAVKTAAAQTPTGTMVTIGCKLPTGFVMQVEKTCISINGANTSKLIGGHGITEDVPLTFWEAWVAEHKNHDFYLNGLVFANSKLKSTESEAKEKVDNASGTEPLDQNDKGTVHTRTAD
ncbi:hypothetical protein RMB03_17425 [Acinetobacter sp. V91_7]|uniref:hypothetical protein n=1 Tax=unclassified Acinetobacter TaxID=196816 RepID=UPI00287F3BC4|nr:MULTISPECIES: hypothetical protein [unclassified Acinetobacter]MDS7935662.1 hypothetical protein [Acinetobacter sp. V91_4B]MDS7964730.1 hypothetical protein [Acinetobacter sp. V91_7]MDS8025575.1 hypothetical protein [Acinetobacter sp. V91_13]